MIGNTGASCGVGRENPIEVLNQMIRVTARIAIFASLGASAGAAQDSQLVFQPSVLVSADRPALAHAEPHLAIDPERPERMLAGVIVLPDGGTSTVEVLYSVDGGRRWTRDTLPGMSQTWAADPWVDFDPDGRPVVVALVGPSANPNGPAILWYYTADSLGAPWHQPLEIGPGDGGGWDAERLAIDRTGGRFHGRAYVIGDKWGPRATGGARTSTIGVATIDTGPRITGIRHAEPNNTSKSASVPVILRDGTMVFAFHEYLPLSQRTRDRWIGGLWITTTEDGGNSFTHRNFIANKLPPGQIALAADQRGDRERLFAFWGTGGELRAAWSDDRGNRWSPDAVAGAYAGSIVVGTTAAVDGRGRVAVMWSSEADGSTAAVPCTEMRIAWSEPGDELQFASRALTETPTCLPVEGGPTFKVGEFVNQTYQRHGNGGDYFGLVGLREGGFVAMWVDGTGQTLQVKMRRVVGR